MMIVTTMKKTVLCSALLAAFSLPGLASAVPAAVTAAPAFTQEAEELARLHQNDRRLAPAERDGFTLLLGFRSWEFAAFTALRRSTAPAAPAVSYQTGPRNR